MTRMSLFAGAGLLLGMIFGIVIVPAIAMAFDNPRMDSAPRALCIVISLPLGTLIGSIFGAISVFQEEMGKALHAMERWQRIVDLRNEPSSTQFKEGPPESN